MPQSREILREQILAAKREGYANNEILSHLLEKGNQQVRDALNEGYSPDEVINFIITPQETAKLPETPVKKEIPQGAENKPFEGDVLRLGRYLTTPTKLIADVYTGKYNLNDFLADLLPVTRTGAVATTGGALTLGTAGLGSGPFLAGLAGSAGMATEDTLLGRYLGEKPTSYISSMGEPSIPEQIVEGTVLNEVGGRVLSGAFRAGRGIFRGLDAALGRNVVPQSLADLEPTFSQYAKPGTRRFSQFMEDSLNAGAKAAQGEKSEALARSTAQELVTDISKRKIDLGSSNEKITRQAEARIIENFEKSAEASGQKGEATKLIAETNPHQIKVQTAPAQQVPSGVLDAQGKPLMKTIPAQYDIEEINGPVFMDETIQHAKRYVDQYEKAAVKDLEAPTYQAAKSVIDTSRAKFDTNGNLLSYDPIPFQQAWNWKQEFGNYAYGSPSYELAKVDARFKPLFRSIDTDIQNSMASSWQNNGQDALRLYNEAKDLVNTRHILFNPGGRAGKNTALLLSNIDQQNEMIDPVIQQINRIVDSPPLLRRALKAGNLNVVLNKQAPTIKTMTSFKKDLRAYQLKRFFDNAIDPKTGVFDTNKLYGVWKDTEKSEAMKLLYSNQERARISQFLKDLEHFEQKPNYAYGTGFALRALSGGLGLTGGIATALLTGGNIPMAALVGGGIPATIYIGGRMISHGLTNPTSAKILQAMVSGQALGMSHKAAARILAQVWRGEPIQAVINGRTVNGTFDAQGNFQEVEPKEETK